jgi:predicted RNase H-like nuclease
MFCDNSPVWIFLSSLGAVEDPEAARTADGGLYIIEVFPAIALASVGNEFFGRLNASLRTGAPWPCGLIGQC